jgi:hypothetical protein
MNAISTTQITATTPRIIGRGMEDFDIVFKFK